MVIFQFVMFIYQRVVGYDNNPQKMQNNVKQKGWFDDVSSIFSRGFSWQLWGYQLEPPVQSVIQSCAPKGYGNPIPPKKNAAHALENTLETIGKTSWFHSHPG
jgi:hypothetical protein